MSDKTPEPPMVKFIVPGEPMPWERAEPKIRGRRVTFRTADRTAEYEKRVRLIAQAERPANWPLRCRYSVEIVVYRSERGDVDNYTKSILDSVNPRRAKYKGKGARKTLVRAAVPGVLWVDDGRVYETHARIIDVAPADAKMLVSVHPLPVRCALKSCGGAQTLYPDEEGRCESCAAKTTARARRAA